MAGGLAQSLFGHRDIASTLSEIITKCPTPFTVGLFGKWGSGKSSIANMITDQLAKDCVPVIMFDVWKHEGDSLRRSFLRELVIQLKLARVGALPDGFALNDRLESAVVATSEGKLKLNKGKLAQLTLAGSLLTIALAGAGFLAYKLGCWDVFKTVVGTLFGGGLVVWLLTITTQVLGTQTTNVTRDKLQDPHEFEDEFARIVRASKASRILIVFDNLDRVTHEKALETLTTIKTFLEPNDQSVPDKGIVFLIPCDDKAIRAHITAVYGSNHALLGSNRTFDPDEFLRKFFNTVLWIPDFIASELESFARLCLQETRIGDLDDEGIAWLVTKAFRENPRQIIQFVNILLSNYLLIKEREGSGKDFEVGFAEQHRLEICLYLLLNHLYPNIMAELRNSKATSLNDIDLSRLETAEPDSIRVRQFQTFLSEVRSEVAISNLRTYYSLRRSEQEKRFPGIDRLFELLEDNEVAKAKEQALAMEGIGDNTEDLSLAIKRHFDDVSNPTTQAYFLNGLLQVLDDRRITLNASCYGVFHARLMHGAWNEKLDIISPKFLHANMLSRFPQFQSSTVDRWITRIEIIARDEQLRKSKEVFVGEAFELFSIVPSMIANCQEKVQEILTSSYASDLRIARLFVKSEEVQRAALSRPFVERFIDSISEGDMAVVSTAPADGTTVPERWLILLSFGDYLVDDELLSACLNKFAGLFDGKAAAPLNAETGRERAMLFTTASRVLDQFLEHTPNAASLVRLAVGTTSNINAIQDWTERSQGVALLIRLFGLAGEPTRSEISAAVQQFYTNATPGGISSCAKLLGTRAALLTIGIPHSVLEQRSISEPEMFDVFYPTLTERDQGEWLLKLLKANPREALRRLKSSQFEVPSPGMIAIGLLGSAREHPLPLKKELLDAVIAMRCGDDEEATKQLSLQIKDLLTNVDLSLQAIGLAVATTASFLSNAIRRDSVKAVYDWIADLPGPSKFQPHALEYLQGNPDDLNTQEQRVLADFCLDELVVKSSDLRAVKIAFRILPSLHVEEGALSKNFLDVRKYYGDCSDQEIRREIREGMKRLRPNPPTSADQETWDWLDSLESAKGEPAN